MTISTTPHINLRGTARAALGFYHAVFGGEIALVSYADAHAVSDPAEKDQIMWGQVSAPGFRVMAYDVPGQRPWSSGDAPYSSPCAATLRARSPRSGKNWPTARPSSCRSPPPDGRRFTAC